MLTLLNLPVWPWSVFPEKAGQAKQDENSSGQHLALLPGGKPQPDDSQFEESQLAEGVKVEQEHTDNKTIAKHIAKDHLQETEDYYRRLPLVEKASQSRSELLAAIAAAAAQTQTDATPQQMSAGNYRKGKVQMHGMTIAIETPAGTIRRGVGKDGKAWANRLKYSYGYILKTLSDADGDHVDCFLGPHPESELVFVVDQLKPGSKVFDEHKCLLGFTNAEDAKLAYLSSYSADWTGFGKITLLTMPQFKHYLESGDTGRPIAEQLDWQWKAAALIQELADDENIPPYDRSRYLTKLSALCDEDALLKYADYAPGLPTKENFGDLSKLQVGQLVDFFRQRHEAERAGPHEDLRIGTPETGLLSWASRKGLPPPGEKHLAIQQPVHRHDYGAWEGQIEQGYGKGKVTSLEKGQILLTKVQPGELHFTTASKRHPERYVMKQTQDKDWLLINTTPTEPLRHEKQQYLKIPQEKVAPLLAQLTQGSSVQEKIDGALSLVRLGKHGVELLSHRQQAGSGAPIIHTERYFGQRPAMDIPPELRGTVLKGELYGVRKPATGVGDSTVEQEPEQAIAPAELGGILNSSVANSLAAQRSRGIQLRNMLFDIAQYGGMSIDPNIMPYAERRRLLADVFKQVPMDRFELSREAKTPEEAVSLWQNIAAGKNPRTSEGIVIHPPLGKPQKAKLVDEYDVHVHSLLPGEGKYQGKGIGSLLYSLEPGGPPVGRVGSGLTDEMRSQWHQDPQAVIGRVARIRATEQLPSGAYRSPSLIALHEDYPPASSEVRRQS